MMDDVAPSTSFWTAARALALVRQRLRVAFDGGGHPGGPGQRR